MNVLIYTGNGTSANAVKQAYTSLKLILGHAYDIMKVDAATLHHEPWQEHCSLIVIPGGRDLPYCHDLKGAAMAKIKQYVHGGGRYVGFCAGAYFASRDIEFEKGTPLEVVGARELAFYPGTSRGTMFPGFVYNSEQGARAVSVYSKRQRTRFKAYYNGGGYFVGATGNTVLCTYTDRGGLSDEVETAAAVQCQVGCGTALLFGFHPEYDISLVDLGDHPQRDEIKKELTASLGLCRQLLSQSLSAIGLRVTVEKNTIDKNEITPLYLSTVSKHLLETMASSWKKETDNYSILRDANDIFAISEIHRDSPDSLTKRIDEISMERVSKDQSPVLQVLYPQATLTDGPQVSPCNLTPSFNTTLFFKLLLEHRKQEWGGGSWYTIGNSVLYSEIITSTQTVLDKNFKFLQCLPSGLVCLATNQISGRGRGRNSWVSQAGALQFSFIIRHQHKAHAPVVFIQYLIALSIVESIRSRKGYEDIPLRLKWPNDIYADLPSGLMKVGGLLVNSSFVNNAFLLVVGCGVNVNNAHPTVSINDVIAQHDPQLERLEKEDLLAHALVTFERYYVEFCEKGMGPWFLDKYYKRWLHSDKLVTLTTHNDERVKIIGITSDYGMLEAVSTTDPRKRFTLQPDGNSFDMLKGLIIEKQ